MRQFIPNFLSYVSAEYYLNWFTTEKVIIEITSSSAIAEKPRCRVGQFQPNVTGSLYFADIIGLFSTTVM